MVITYLIIYYKNYLSNPYINIFNVFNAVLIDPIQHINLLLVDDILKTCSVLKQYSIRLES